jgi:hypothetical protein
MAMIEQATERAILPALQRRDTCKLTSFGMRLWSMVHPPANGGKRVLMSGKSPQMRGAKKVAQSTIKEKRAAKRAKQDPSTFIRSRKDAKG